MTQDNLLEEIQQDFQKAKSNKSKKPRKPRAKKVEKPGVLKRIRKWVVFTLIAFIGVAIVAELYVDWRSKHEWQSPIVFRSPIVTLAQEEETEEIVKPLVEELIETEEAQESGESAKMTWHGTASYYSWDGCVGCNPQRIMANGEVLDDMKKTLAFNKLPMNTEVVITNLSNGVKTKAVVTDTGGFEKLGRIADLSVATKEILGCDDLCQVRIEQF